MKKPKNPHAVALGRIKSKKKADHCRKIGHLGGLAKARNVKEKRKGYIDFEAAVVLSIIALIIAMFVLLIFCSIAGNSEEVYQAWRKANPSQTISYEEWKTLKSEHLLPGQPPEQDAPIIIQQPMYIK